MRHCTFVCQVKMNPKFSAIFKLLAAVLQVVSADDCRVISSGVFGYSLTSRVIRQASASSYQECLSACERQSNCYSVNFVEAAAVNSTCELNWSNRYRDPQYFRRRENSTYSQSLPSRDSPGGYSKFFAI